MMGKLHTLRRAILREPEKFKNRGAYFDKRSGQWKPKRWTWGGDQASYKAFIRHVLHEAYLKVEPRASVKQVSLNKSFIRNKCRYCDSFCGLTAIKDQWGFWYCGEGCKDKYADVGQSDSGVES